MPIWRGMRLLKVYLKVSSASIMVVTVTGEVILHYILPLG